MERFWAVFVSLALIGLAKGFHRVLRSRCSAGFSLLLGV